MVPDEVIKYVMEWNCIFPSVFHGSYMNEKSLPIPEQYRIIVKWGYLSYKSIVKKYLLVNTIFQVPNKLIGQIHDTVLFETSSTSLYSKSLTGWEAGVYDWYRSMEAKRSYVPDNFFELFYIINGNKSCIIQTVSFWAFHQVINEHQHCSIHQAVIYRLTTFLKSRVFRTLIIFRARGGCSG